MSDHDKGPKGSKDLREAQIPAAPNDLKTPAKGTAADSGATGAPKPRPEAAKAQASTPGAPVSSGAVAASSKQGAKEPARTASPAPASAKPVDGAKASTASSAPSAKPPSKPTPTPGSAKESPPAAPAANAGKNNAGKNNAGKNKGKPPPLKKKPAEPVREELEPAQAPPEEPPAKDKPRRGGRLLGLLACLIALAAAGGVGWLYYELIYKTPVAVATLESELEAVASERRAQNSALERRLGELEQNTSSRIAEVSEKLTAANKTTRSEVLASLNKVANSTPPMEKEWRLAEAEYLMRIANHRVLMERDADNALRLLSAADAILEELNDFALHDVRARLADEMLALNLVRKDDLQGAFLQLEALKEQILKLPIGVPNYTIELPTAPAEDVSVWEGIKMQLKGIISYRDLKDSGERVEPLLPPDEAHYLELNLRLMVERGQLALLRRDELVYHQSLTSMADWVDDYLDVDDADVARFQEVLEELQQVKLSRTLPDVSGSLTELMAIRRGQP